MSHGFPRRKQRADVAQMLGDVVEVVILGQADRLLERLKARLAGGCGQDRGEHPIRERLPVLEGDAVLPKSQPNVVVDVVGAVLAGHPWQRPVEQALDPLSPSVTTIPIRPGDRIAPASLSHGSPTLAPTSSIAALGRRPVVSRPTTAQATLHSTPRLDRARRPRRGPAGTRVPSISIAGTSARSSRGKVRSQRCPARRTTRRTVAVEGP